MHMMSRCRYEPGESVAMIWRVGRKVGRTIYLQAGEEPSDDDRLIGMMDTPELAQIVAAAVNSLQQPVPGIR